MKWKKCERNWVEKLSENFASSIILLMQEISKTNMLGIINFFLLSLAVFLTYSTVKLYRDLEESDPVSIGTLFTTFSVSDLWSLTGKFQWNSFTNKIFWFWSPKISIKVLIQLSWQASLKDFSLIFKMVFSLFKFLKFHLNYSEILENFQNLPNFIQSWYQGSRHQYNSQKNIFPK